MNIDLQQLQNHYASKIGVLEANATLYEVQIAQLQKEKDELQKQLDDLKSKQSEETEDK